MSRTKYYVTDAAWYLLNKRNNLSMFLDFLAVICNKFRLDVEPKTDYFKTNKQGIWVALKGCFIKKKIDSERYGTHQRFKTAHYFFRLTPKTLQFIKHHNVLNWSYIKELPENINFYKGDCLIMRSISHEGIFWLFLTKEEFEKLQKLFKNKLVLTEEGLSARAIDPKS